MNILFRTMGYFLFVEVVAKCIVFTRGYSKLQKLFYIVLFIAGVFYFQMKSKVLTYYEKSLYDNVNIPRKSYDFDNWTDIIELLRSNFNTSLSKEEELLLNQQINTITL